MTEDTVWLGRGGPECANAGDSAAPAVNSSSAAVTRRCAADWVAPASGTWAGRPTLRTAALISAITHHTSWSQASQMTTDSTRRIDGMPSWWVSTDRLAVPCGTGNPMMVIRAIGTPMVSTARAMIARIPISASPAVRVGTCTGFLSPGIGGAISTLLVEQRSRIRTWRSRWRSR